MQPVEAQLFCNNLNHEDVVNVNNNNSGENSTIHNNSYSTNDETDHNDDLQ